MLDTSKNPFQRLVSGLSRRWLMVFVALFGVYVGLPFLAPVFMRLDWQTPARGIYTLYSLFCHQLPERSIFLFGSRAMYPLDEIQAAWQNTYNPLLLRQFIGSPEMGWKVAWSDRMVAMYTSILLFALLWYPVRKRIPRLPWWGFVLLFLPMTIDGMSHLLSDLWGVEQGFRQYNLWLAELTSHRLPASFYAGNALGSFNSWMRWLSGLLFGLGVVWFAFPYLDEFFTS